MIPLCDLSQQYLSHKDEIDQAMISVAQHGQYILGPNVAALEREIADYCQCKYAVGVNSGTDALHLALMALGIGPGDEVITTPFTFVATTEAIGLVGATPVFVDINPLTFNIDPDLIEAAITSRTRAILPVHLYGRPCDMEAIVGTAACHGLEIVEDCAQAIGASYHGRKVGSFGTAGCLSFFPSKNLGCFGDGGMFVTNDPQLYERVEILRRHGGKVKYHHSTLGLNSRLDELQATILHVKLKYLDEWNAARRRAADRYDELLANDDGVKTPMRVASGHIDDTWSVYHQYTIRVSDRASLESDLVAAGIGYGIYYPVPLHLQEVHRSLGHREGAFPAAEAAARQCLSLPMFPELTPAQQQQVAECVHQAVAAAASGCAA